MNNSNNHNKIVAIATHMPAGVNPELRWHKVALASYIVAILALSSSFFINYSSGIIIVTLFMGNIFFMGQNRSPQI